MSGRKGGEEERSLLQEDVFHSGFGNVEEPVPQITTTPDINTTTFFSALDDDDGFDPRKPIQSPFTTTPPGTSSPLINPTIFSENNITSSSTQQSTPSPNLTSNIETVPSSLDMPIESPSPNSIAVLSSRYRSHSLDAGKSGFNDDASQAPQYDYENYETIDWNRDAINDRRQRNNLDKKKGPWFTILFKLYFRSQAWILIVLIAVSSGFLAGVVDVGTEWLSDLRFGFCQHGFHISRSQCCPGNRDCSSWTTWSNAMRLGIKTGWLMDYFLYILCAIIFAGLSAWFVKSFARFAAGSGIPEVKTILGGFVIKSFATPMTLLIKCVGLILTVSAGLNAGKEGPMVHVAVCCGELFARLFPKYSRNQGKKREILSAAAAAGVSVAFGAPIGGVLFSLEEVSYYFPHKVLWRTFFCANIAALALSLMNPLHTGKLVIFEVKYDRMWHYFELIPFIVVALICGLMGVFFIRMNIRMCFFRRNSRLRHFPIIEAMIVAGFTALVSFLNPHLSGNTGETVSNLFGECYPADPSRNSDLCNTDTSGETVLSLLTATLTRLFLVIFTFGLRIPAGVFIPGIAIGASLGRAIGIMVEMVHRSHGSWALFAVCKSSDDCITPGVYAIVGAAAMLSGVTRMTVSLVVIVFELTGQLDYILPLMLAVMVSKWVADAFGRDGIYDEHIALNGYPFLDNKREYRFTSQADDVMTSRDLVVIEEQGHTVATLKAFLQMYRYTGFPIVHTKEDMIIKGYITRAELRFALDRASTKPGSDSTPCYFTEPIKPLVGVVGGDSSPNWPGVNGESPQQSRTLFGGWEDEDHSDRPYIDMTPLTDRAPLRVSENTPLNTIFDMFKKLGLRVCMVDQGGRLVGLITKKDILQHISTTFRKKNVTFINRAS
eukprot:TRINITY_DN7322_c0_g1_i2.p1 TRINITY_DN7322_c0_g1~~TRINITY_DN7322_c0_g1_i2.p1  ORF type:complete len:889 (+),score=170.66 TRINITY_DN7322_c0_g1_i2:280-2946(+)